MFFVGYQVLGIQWVLGMQYLGDVVEVSGVEVVDWVIWMLFGDFFQSFDLFIYLKVFWKVMIEYVICQYVQVGGDGLCVLVDYCFGMVVFYQFLYFFWLMQVD